VRLAYRGMGIAESARIVPEIVGLAIAVGCGVDKRGRGGGGNVFDWI